MRIVKKPAQTEEIIKKSRFISLLLPCDSEQQAKQLLIHYNQQYPDASHLVYAYRIQSNKGFICRFYDAGEPSGTAGKPIFQHLEGKQLINVLLIVIRYFGGIKLGAGGLTRAYGNSAKKVIEHAEIVDFIAMSEIRFTLDYKQLQNLEYQLKKLNGQIIEQQFGENISVRIRLPEDNLPALKALFGKDTR